VVTECDVTPREKQFNFGLFQHLSPGNVDLLVKTEQNFTHIGDTRSESCSKLKISHYVGGLLVLLNKLSTDNPPKSAVFLLTGKNLIDGFEEMENIFVMRARE